MIKEDKKNYASNDKIRDLKELIDFKSYPINKILDYLLVDKTTKKNIIFATDSYLSVNENFTYETQITSGLLANTDSLIFQPRITKELSEQVKRTKKRAEVFTPSWICNKMNNYCDEEWFGKKEIFNKEMDKSWVTIDDKINFSDKKTWKEYVLDKRLEIACGEAPYIISRYDASTGKIIMPLTRRIGLLDRKLRIVNENTKTENEWFEWTLKAFQSVYGYEFQGDNLLIARINLLVTFTDYLKDKWNRYATFQELKKVANIICWNFWQMNGLTGNVPFKPQNRLIEQTSLFEEPIVEKTIIECQIKDWNINKAYSYNCIKGMNNMKKFDFVIGNPPYQEMDGGAAASAKPVYHFFVRSAKKISNTSCLIMPSRWMTGGKGLDDFRNEMIHDRHLKGLVDYFNCKELFNNVDIKGGVCYYLYSNEYNGKCNVISHTSNEILEATRLLAEEDEDIFVRDNRILEIKNKVAALGEPTLDTIVSASKPYGLRAETMVNASKYGLPNFSFDPIANGFSILGLGENKRRTWKYIPNDYPIPKINHGLNKYKVFIAEAYGCGAIGEVPSTPVLGTPGELCTETFLQIGPFDSEEEASNMISYIKTKFFRLLVGIQKQTQHTTSKAYRFVPIQDFSTSSNINWNVKTSDLDKQLYKKYNLSNNDINFIESVIKEMK